MYGKINDNGRIELLHSRVVTSDGRKIANPTKEQLLSLGYKEIVSAVDEGAEAVRLEYVEEDEVIVIRYKEDVANDGFVL